MEVVLSPFRKESPISHRFDPQSRESSLAKLIVLRLKDAIERFFSAEIIELKNLLRAHRYVLLRLRRLE